MSANKLIKFDPLKVGLEVLYTLRAAVKTLRIIIEETHISFYRKT